MADLTREPPSLQTLTMRIEQYCEFAITDASAEHLARLITNKCLEGAICSGAIVNGKWRALRFADFYEQVFQMTLDGRPLKARKKVAR